MAGPHRCRYALGMSTAPAIVPAVNRLVPFAHVVDVDASIGFYALLGFEPGHVLREPNGRAYWSMLSSGSAEIMLARASGPIDASQQAVLFYMYASNVASLRTHLLSRGVPDGSHFQGESGSHSTNAVFKVAHPPHMPAGELRVHDLDGYCILVGQLT